MGIQAETVNNDYKEQLKNVKKRADNKQQEGHKEKVKKTKWFKKDFSSIMK